MFRFYAVTQTARWVKTERKTWVSFKYKSTSADPFYSMKNMEELERRVADIRSGKSTLKEHELVEVD